MSQSAEVLCVELEVLRNPGTGAPAPGAFADLKPFADAADFDVCIHSDGTTPGPPIEMGLQAWPDVAAIAMHIVSAE